MIRAEQQPGAVVDEDNLRTPLVLFGVIQELIREQKIRKKEYSKIASVLENIDNILSTDPDELSPKDFKFFDAATKHVTDLSARKIRHEFMKRRISEKIKI